MGPRQRRRWCFHCGGFICGYCWHHQHQCAPSHAVTKCWSLRAYQKFGKHWRKRLRAVFLEEPGNAASHNMEAMARAAWDEIDGRDA